MQACVCVLVCLCASDSGPYRLSSLSGGNAGELNEEREGTGERTWQQRSGWRPGRRVESSSLISLRSLPREKKRQKKAPLDFSKNIQCHGGSSGNQSHMS